MRAIGLVACAIALSLAPALSADRWTGIATQEAAQPAAAAPATGEIPPGETTVRKADGSVDAVYRYRLVEPSGESIAKAGGKLPLIVFLHGSGERGSDNTAQLKHFVGWTATEEFQSKAPSFVLAVQCPSNESWAPFDLKAFTERGEFPKMAKEPSRAMKAVMQAMDEVIATKPVDRERVYLTGLSMGGFGAFDLAARRPEFFAAVVPICGGGDPSTAPLLSKTPHYIIHSNYDPVVPNDLSRKMSREIGAATQRAWQEASARAATAKPPQPVPPRVRNPAYREYDGVGHDCWTPAYRFGADGALDWMLGKRRQDGSIAVPQPPVPAPSAPNVP
ncbi:MAG: alpha/beta hydrolase-fold protein [bacterium]